jgi:hypothetical protein
MRRLLSRLLAVATLQVCSVGLSGCVSVQGGPERLYSVAEESAHARVLLDGTDTTGGLVSSYYAIPPAPANDAMRMSIRNEIVARRMYIIDVEYSKYEAALTSERQKLGFATTTAATGLGIASTLVTHLQTAQILSGVGAGLLGARGAYDSEVIIAKTLQIVQGHMRAQRDDVFTKQIFPRLNESTVTYPLSAALGDVEDYYRAGTFNSGLIPALRESGTAADNAAAAKSNVVRGVYGVDSSARALVAFLRPNGTNLSRARVSCVNRCLNNSAMLHRPGTTRINITARLYDASPLSATIRVHALQCAQQACASEP